MVKMKIICLDANRLAYAIIYLSIISDFAVNSKRAPIQLDGVQKARTAEKNKGILRKLLQ